MSKSIHETADGGQPGRLESCADAPARVRALAPGRASLPDASRPSGGDVDPAPLLDTTHFDTVRFPPPSWALEEFARAAADGAQAYSEHRGHLHVRERLAGSIGAFLGHPVDPEHELLLTPGTQGGLFAVLAARIAPGARVALVDPDYLYTSQMLRFFDADVGFVPLRVTPAGPIPDLEVLEQEFRDRGARHFIFSHPNNPTGSVYGVEVVAALRELVARYDVHVVADELYSRLLYSDVPFAHFATDPAAFARTVTLLGPSKTESLSGYRLGVVVGPRPTIDAAETMLSVMALRAPAYAQNVLLRWLSEDAAWLRDRIREFDVLRRMTKAAFAHLPWARAMIQDATAYAWIDVTALGLPDEDLVGTLRREAQVIVSPGSRFGPSGRGHFRVCYARDEAAWRQALTRMTSVLRRLAAERGVQ